MVTAADPEVTLELVRPILLSHWYAPDEHLVWVGGRIVSWDIALVEVTTSDGFVGVGEVAQGIMGAAAVPGVVDALGPYLVGLDAADPAGAGDALRAKTVFWARGGIARGVIGAVEQALWDALGKRRSLPAYLLLGDQYQEKIEVYASGGLGTTTDDIIDWARKQEVAGLATVKFRAMQTPARTIELLGDVVGELAKGTRFVLDAVQGCASRPWELDDAIEVGRVAADLGARWYEEPCHADDVAGFAHVRQRVAVPVSGVESYTNPFEFERLLEHDGVDIAQPDVAMVGGPRELQRVAASAQRRGVGVVPHVWGSGVTLMANLHTALATPGMDLVELCTIPNPLRDELLLSPLQFDGSSVLAPTAVGWGVSVTPDVEARFPYKPGGGHVIA